MASLFHQREIFASHIFARIDVLKDILIIYFVNKLDSTCDRVLVAVATKNCCFPQ